MHRGQLAEVGVFHEQVKGLRLINEITALTTHVYDIFHAELPSRLVEFFDVFRNALNLLNRSVGAHELLLHSLIPQSAIYKIF